MKVSIVGYGKMGKMIHSVLIDKNIDVIHIVDPYSDNPNVNKKEIDLDLKKCDVVLDFSSPISIMDNINFYVDNSINALIGTTGWYDNIPLIKDRIKDNKIIYSGNFSLGVAIFLKMVKKAGELINSSNLYDTTIREIHHKGKADSPSGTALMIGETLLRELDNKDTLLIGNSEGKIKDNELQIVSERVGAVPGEHSVIFDSDADTITLTHTARSRIGFALGAVTCAEWLMTTDKKGLLTLDDYLEEKIGE